MDSSRRAAQHAASFERRRYIDPFAIEMAKGLTRTLRESGFKVSRRYDVVTITGEPRKLASKKRQRGRKAR